MPMRAYVGIQNATDGTSAITQTGSPDAVGCAATRSRHASSSQAERTNGQHQPQVRRLGAHPAEHVELEVEQVGLVDVAEAAPVADHRVLLGRLELLAALEAAELVGAEVDAAVDDRAGRERARDGQQRLGHRVDELLLLPSLDQQPRVHALQRVGDHELGPRAGRRRRRASPPPPPRARRRPG